MLSQYQQALLGLLDFKPPAEYLAYLFTAESCYQFGGAYLVEDHELLAYNTGREATEYYSGYFLIGANGGSEAFAIEKASGRFVETPFIGHGEETPIILGLTWPEFLAYLQTEYY